MKFCSLTKHNKSNNQVIMEVQSHNSMYIGLHRCTFLSNPLSRCFTAYLTTHYSWLCPENLQSFSHSRLKRIFTVVNTFKRSIFFIYAQKLSAILITRNQQQHFLCIDLNVILMVKGKSLNFLDKKRFARKLHTRAEKLPLSDQTTNLYCALRTQTSMTFFTSISTSMRKIILFKQ